jgi:hypothetical protein
MVDLQLPMQSVYITTEIVISDGYNIVSNLRHVDGFPRVIRFPPPVELIATM